MVRRLVFLLLLGGSPALADSNTTCTRSMLGTFVNCTTTDDHSNEQISNGVSALTAAIIARNAERRAEKRVAQQPPSRVSTPLVDLTNGNGFYSGCASIGSAENFGLCYGFVQGFLQREWLAGKSAYICMPEKATLKQMLDVINAYLANTPQYRDRPMGELTYMAFEQAFPCAPPPPPAGFKMDNQPQSAPLASP